MTEQAEKCIIFVGGGTMGHIAPLVAVMEAVKRQDPKVHLAYAGLLSDIKSPALEACELDFTRHAITAGKLNRFATPRHLTELLKFGKGFSDAVQLIRELQPQAVFCKGGFVSVPVALVARWMGIPVFSHESDAVPGLANRLLARVSQRVFTAFPEKVYDTLPRKRLKYVGQPVRAKFFKELAFPTMLTEDHTLALDVPLLFVTASQGSRKVNSLISANWKELLADFQVVHQCGELDYKNLLEDALTLTKEEQNRLHLMPSVQNMAPLLQHAELVVSRAGGIIAELAASKAATILIPLSTAAQNHQWENAQVLARAEAAVVLNEVHLSSASLLAVIRELHTSAKQRRELRERIAAFAKPEAAEVIARELLAVV